MDGQPAAIKQVANIQFACDASHGAFAALTDGKVEKLTNVFRLTPNGWQPGGGKVHGLNSTHAAFCFGMSEKGDLYVGMGNDSGGGDGLYRSTDQGRSWTAILKGSNGIQPHHDQRCWFFGGGQVFEGNDGGIYRFNDNWECLNTDSLHTLLANGIGVDPIDPNILVVGSQDNGLARREQGRWRYQPSDDNGPVVFSPVISGGGQYVCSSRVSDPATFVYSTNSGESFTPDSQPGIPFPDFGRAALHPTQDRRVLFPSTGLFEARDGKTFAFITPPLSGSDVITALAYGGGDSIYAAVSSRVFHSPDDGLTVNELTNGAKFRGAITSIAVDRNAEGVIYLGTDGGQVWRGVVDQWENVSGNLPLAVTALALLATPAPGVTWVFAGTSAGVYVTTAANGKKTCWSRFGEQLPQSKVSDIYLNTLTKQLFAALYGRGVWATIVGPTPSCP